VSAPMTAHSTPDISAQSANCSAVTAREKHV
jgi:hypothetical protein